MRAIGFSIRQICHINGFIKSILKCYKVKAIYFGAQKLKGIRAALYKNAELYLAHYSLTEGLISYNESDDLHISLLFHERSHAQRYQTFLRQWHYNNPLVVKGDVVSVSENLEVFIFDKYLKDACLSNYDCEGSLSLTQALSECSVSSASSECASMESGLAKHQSVEKPDLFKFSYPPSRNAPARSYKIPTRILDARSCCFLQILAQSYKHSCYCKKKGPFLTRSYKIFIKFSKFLARIICKILSNLQDLTRCFLQDLAAFSLA